MFKASCRPCRGTGQRDCTGIINKAKRIRKELANLSPGIFAEAIVGLDACVARLE